MFSLRKVSIVVRLNRNVNRQFTERLLATGTRTNATKHREADPDVDVKRQNTFIIRYIYGCKLVRKRKVVINMSDTEIEDVSFLPGENLHRKNIYEPSILQRCCRMIGRPSRDKAPIIAVIIALFILVVILLAVFAHPACTKDTTADCSKCSTDSSSATTTLTPPSTTSAPNYTATNGKPFPWHDVRLPRSVLPHHYQIFLHPNLSQSEFTGSVDIQCHVVKAADFIVFHLKELNITQLTVTRADTQLKLAEDFLEYKQNEQVYLKLGSSLEAGTNVTVSVSFKGKLVSKMTGFYKSMYKTADGTERYIATTQFEPTDARAAFPCFDEPDLKAVFKLSMVRDKEYVTLFNMPLSTTKKYNDDLVVDNFRASVNMSTYLVAFVVCDYSNRTSLTRQGTMVRVFAPSEQIEMGEYALHAAVKILDYYDEFFGIKYPLPKQDLIAIPDFAAGAMENWGLITYRMTAIMYDPQKSSASSKQWVAVVVAHELAHQWFGNLVTMDWWDDLWLNEGFASFVENIGATIVDQSFHMDEQFVMSKLQTALHRDSFASSHAIKLPLENPNQINEIFDSITYQKGASIIRMLENFLGNETFKAGLQAYLQKYQYSNAVTKDLWNALSKAQTSGTVNIADLMDTWTLQMGYPVVTLTSAGNGKVKVTQDRFLLYPNTSIKTDSLYGYVWQVPFSYRTSKGGELKKLLLKDQSATIDIKDNNWLLGNPGMHGFYRTNYDVEKWAAIIKQLNLDLKVFTPAERAGLISDAFQLSRAGLMSVNQTLDLTEYLVQDMDYLPWRAFLTQMGYLEDRIQNTLTFKYVKAYMLKLMNKLLKKFKWQKEEDHLQIFLQANVLNTAVRFGHTDTINKGKQLFQTWKTNHSNVDVNLKRAVLRAGIMYGYQKDWEACYKAYLEETVPSEKMTLLAALSYTPDVRLLSRLLTYSLDKDIVRSQDTSGLIGSISANPAGHLLVWRFFQQNWPTFQKRYGEGSFTMSGLIKNVASDFDTKFDYDEINQFFSTRDAGSGQRAVSEVKEMIQMNIEWREKQEQPVTCWLTDHGQAP